MAYHSITCPECKSVVAKTFVQILYPCVKDDNNIVYKELSDEKKSFMKADSFEKSNKMLTERIKTLESENLKLKKEKDAFKDENIRLKVQVEQLKSQNKVEKDLGANCRKTETQLQIMYPSCIQDKHTLKIEEVPVEGLY